ncbi:MAG: PD-(D/E)XK nuclease family protein [Sphingomonadaceae bacterium]|nr:PD-(D/E)XK nuclease family protein [Sphingomonadaceae bacterium]
MSALRATPRIATIPAHAPFAEVLAARLLAAAEGDPLALARGLVLLPNRRAAGALTRAFLRQRDGLLLPRMVAIADLDDADAPIDETGADLPAAVPAVERRFHLAAALRRSGGRPPLAALRDAATLGSALDTLTLAGRRAAELDGVAPADLSAWWARTTAELRVIAELWPAKLAAEGRIDEAARRVALYELTAKRWAETGAGGRLVMAAGIVQAPAALGPLLKVIARLPNGAVVLPGLDLAMSEDAWGALNPADPSLAAHPQAALKALLDALGVARGEVERWDAPDPRTAARVGAVARALDPAAFMASAEADGAALADVTLIEAATPAEEALVAAAALRRALEEPEQTAALITPDRELAARTIEALRRWGIEADDSAGVPLARTPPGVFVRLLADAAATEFAPLPVLAMLQHPFAGGDDRQAHLDAVRLLDMKLRKHRPGPGPGGYASLAEDAAKGWWAGVAAALEPLAAAELTLADWLGRLAAAGSALAGERLWAGEDGRALGEWVEATARAAEPFGAVGAVELPALLAELMGGVAVRPAHGLHPRVSVLGLLEARLSRADVHVLGGLNEGVWPAPPSPDPWLPPAVRKELRLPPAERRIGLAAHDFVAALGAPTVILTRALRDAEAPTIASRFALRLLALARGQLATDEELRAVARGLDAPAGPPRLAERPAPRPPLAARPRTLRLSQVDTLRSDPFAFYAAEVLRLGELEPPGAEPGARERGTFLHEVLDLWAKSGSRPADLVPFVRQRFAAQFGGDPRLRALWWPRLENALGWAAGEFERLAAEGWHYLASETGGELVIDGVTLKGRPDRVEIGPDGALAIIDFKSGSVPDVRPIAAGYALQPALLGLMAREGALPGVPRRAPARLEWWRLVGGKSDPGKIRDAVAFKWPEDIGQRWADGPEAVAAAEADLRAAIGQFLSGLAPFTAKLKPEFAGASTRFDQLARLEEWADRLTAPPAAPHAGAEPMDEAA